MSWPADVTSLLLAGIDAVDAVDTQPRPTGRGGGASAASAALPPVDLVAFFEERAERFRVRRDSGAAYRRSLNPYRAFAGRRLGHRAWRRDTGLSNPAYLAASTGTQYLRVQVESARVKFTFSDPIAESLTPVDGVGGKRGEITCLSDAARERLANRAWALGAEGHEPEVMVTLTSPANWERVYICDEDGQPLGGGRLLKAHLQAFRKRLERFLKRHGITSWSALWFLEFQSRGAPHVHLMLFGCKLPERVRRSLRNWCGVAWSSVVGNPDRVELGKHRRAGTQVARMRCKHFGYAVKYATKTEQKEVPSYFRDVGRFWGCWNYSSPDPLVLDVDFSRLNPDEAGWVRRLLVAVVGTVYQHSPTFAASRLAKMERTLTGGLARKFGFTVFGAAGREAALPLLA